MHYRYSDYEHHVDNIRDSDDEELWNIYEYAMKAAEDSDFTREQRHRSEDVAQLAKDELEDRGYEPK